ncbi:MAG: peptide-methionine (S)-S-oxide reductase MsrA [Deltaproteobacteria bacterium]|nr:peptide-methionine (S)-S-oxide reductase MsrA [Deltaproteobacteria bacterium]
MKQIMLTVAAALLLVAHTASAQQLPKAVFAGGCFWCVESDFDKVPGVVSTVSGYTGGKTADPTYRQVTAGGTGHYEAVEITYDPAKVGYEALLTAFWHSVDPTDDGGQFCDRGQSYETAVFVANDKERRLAEASKAAAQKQLDRPIVTPILPAGPFFAAEDYHQDYYKKNPVRYRYYRFSCGRNRRVRDVWGEHAYEGIPGHG